MGPPGATPLTRRKRRLVAVITILLVAGFVTTSLAAYLVSGRALREQIQSSGLPLTSDNIYSDIQNDLLPPILVSATMAQDTFLRDWVLNGEEDISRIIRYLTEVRARNNTISAFFVSEETRRYYHPTGIVESVTREDPTDEWFFRVRGMEDDYEINVDYDQANEFSLTVFINYRVYDYNDNFIGVTGVGLNAASMLDRLDRYEDRYERQICFVSPAGEVILRAGDRNVKTDHLQDIPGLAELADRILDTDAGRWEYSRDGETILLNTRYIPELDWYLFVEQPAGAATAPVRRAFFLNLGVGLGIALLVVLLTHFTIQAYQRRLERMATTDQLTGAANRHGFQLLSEAADRAARGQDSLILFDLDRLKEVNDRHGHLVGDQVIREVADIARELLRSSDVLCRWGGEEFVVWLRGCTTRHACEIAEKMRTTIRAHRFTAEALAVTASFGIAAHRPGENMERSLGRADQALYRAKRNGRDQAEVSDS